MPWHVVLDDDALANMGSCVDVRKRMSSWLQSGFDAGLG